MSFRFLRRSWPRWQRILPAVRDFPPYIVRNFSQLPAASKIVHRDPGDHVVAHDVEADALRWVHELFRHHASTFEFRMLPKGSNVSFLIRPRNPQDEDLWAGVILRSCVGPRRSSPDFVFDLKKIAIRADECVVMLTCAPAGYLWLFDPASTMPRLRYAVSPTGKDRENLVDPSQLEERFRDLFASTAVKKANWLDWFVISAPNKSILRSRELLRQLVCLRPFDRIQFPQNYRTTYNAILDKKRLLCRCISPMKNAPNGGLVSLTRTTWPAGKKSQTPFDVTDEFEHVLILSSDGVDVHRVVRIGILRKSDLIAHGYISDRANGVPGRSKNMFVRWGGDFSGTGLAGLEDSFIDVRTASVEGLQDFVQRQLSES